MSCRGVRGDSVRAKATVHGSANHATLELARVVCYSAMMINEPGRQP